MCYCYKKDQITVDFTGTSNQINRPINSVFNYTYAYACYALKCAIDPTAPNNDGSFRPVKIIAPEGTVVNPSRGITAAGRRGGGAGTASPVRVARGGRGAHNLACCRRRSVAVCNTAMNTTASTLIIK